MDHTLYMRSNLVDSSLRYFHTLAVDKISNRLKVSEEGRTTQEKLIIHWTFLKQGLQAMEQNSTRCPGLSELGFCKMVNDKREYLVRVC